MSNVANSVISGKRSHEECGHIEKKDQDAASISIASQRPKTTFGWYIEI